MKRLLRCRESLAEGAPKCCCGKLDVLTGAALICLVEVGLVVGNVVAAAVRFLRPSPLPEGDAGSFECFSDEDGDGLARITCSLSGGGPWPSLGRLVHLLLAASLAFPALLVVVLTLLGLSRRRASYLLPHIAILVAGALVTGIGVIGAIFPLASGAVSGAAGAGLMGALIGGTLAQGCALVVLLDAYRHLRSSRPTALKDRVVVDEGDGEGAVL